MIKNKLSLAGLTKMSLSDSTNLSLSGLTRQSLHHLSFLFLSLILSISILSCSNALQPEAIPETYNSQQTEDSGRAYLVFNFGNNITDSSNSNQASRSISSNFTPALFTNIVFSGSDGAGHTVSETASSFSELSGKRIYVDVGSWSFTLNADYGSGPNPEKYKATATSVAIQPGPNSVRMSLSADTSAPSGETYNPADHPGSYSINVTFPAGNVDLVRFEITDLSGTLLNSAEKTKPADFSGTGTKTVTFAAATYPSGAYIINVQFKKINRNNPASTNLYEEICSPWGEVLLVNPGVQTTGTITLPETRETYSITYNLGEGAAWNPSYDGDIILSYTKNGGDYLPSGGRANYITLPPEDAVLKDGNVFDGWYTDAACSPGAHVTSFNISDKENKTFYAKWHEAVFDVYISCDGSDDDYVNDATPYGDGTRDHPFKTITRCYSQTPKVFEDITAQRVDGSPACTVHVLSDYTGTDAFTWGQGTEIEDAKIRIIGAKGGTDGNAVTLTANLPGATDPQCFIYLQQNQQFEVSYVNLTTDKHLSDTQDYCGYGAYNCSTETTLKLTNCSIQGYYAQGTMLNVSGTVWLDNVEIKDNYAVSDPTKYDIEDYWGCGVAVTDGTLHIKNKVVVKNNTTLKNNGTDLHRPWNIWIGNGTIFNPIEIDGAITDSDIGVKLDKDIRTFTNNYASIIGATDPTTYFTSDYGFDIGKNATSGEAEVLPYVYVNGSAPDDTGNGSQASPYKTLESAVTKITSIDSNTVDAKIYISGTVNTNIILSDDDSMGTKLKAGSLTIEGRGTGSNWKTAAAASVISGDINGDGTGDDTIITNISATDITFKNLTLKNGNSSTSGGAISNDGGADININSCIIEANTASANGGAIYISGSDLTITNAEIKENKASGLNSDNTGKGCGGAIFVSHGEVIIDDTVEISSNFSSNYGGAVYIKGTSATNKGKLTMNGGSIHSNGTFTQGGGVYVAAYGELVMDGENSELSGNVVMRSSEGNTAVTRIQGGAVYVAENGTFTMNNGSIHHNSATSGAAVYIRGKGNLNEGTISSNHRRCTGGGSLFPNASAIDSNNISTLNSKVSAILGSATDVNKTTSNIEIGVPGQFNMAGGTITSEYTQGQNGAGVNLYADSNSNGDPSTGTAEFNMSGGFIKDLNITGNMGCGAVSMKVFNGSATLKFNMSGGKITGNTSTGQNATTNHAGGVYVGHCGEFHMSGGEISGNKAVLDNGVGGVLIDSTGDMDNISLGEGSETRTVLIKNNKRGSSNLVSNLKLNPYNVIAINSPLSTDSEVGITKDFSTDDFTTGFATNNPGVSPSEIFTSDNGYVITPDIDVEGKFAYGTINVTPGFPGNYVCKWSQTVSGSTRTINITVKDSSTGTPLEVGTTAGTINSVSVDLYEGADKITSSNSLSFTYPSYLDPPSGTPFYVKFNVKVDATTQYSYDYWPDEGASALGGGLYSIPGITTTANLGSSVSSVFNGRELKIPVGNKTRLIASDHEVTQGEYTAYCKFGETQPPEAKGAGDNYPAYYVNWYDAIIYCNLKTINDPALGLEHCVYSLGGDKDPRNWDYDGRDTSDGKYCGPSSENDDWNDGITFDQNADGWRLPTEAEWEYLARGGNLTGTQTTYSGSDTVGNVAWYSQNSGDDGTSTNKKSHEVKGKTANSLGLYDMSGNVCEWCWDRYSGSINSSTPAIGVNASTFSRVKRGGCFSLGASYAEVSYRSGDLAHSRNNINYYGFRVVRSSD